MYASELEGSIFSGHMVHSLHCEDNHPPVHVQLENEKIWTEFSKFINENM
jgi:hypothetical protein